MKNKRIMACLLAGALVLSVSSVVAFGSVSGYNNLKSSVKSLAFDTDNATFKGNLNISYDDDAVAAYEVTWKKDGKNTSVETKETNKNGEVAEDYETTINGIVENYYPERNVIERYEAEDIQSFESDEEATKRAYKFIEVGVDTIVGDLKNNFILVDSSRDSSTYHVSISNYQIPELINAGLSLLAYTSTTGMEESYNLIWEDQNALINNKYEEQTGKALPEDFENRYGMKDWDDEMTEASEQYDEISAETWDSYYQILSSQYDDGGVLYIKTDGSYEHYANIKEVVNKYPDAAPDDLFVYVGNDLILDNVDFTFTVDDSNRLTSCEAIAVFATQTEDGIHNITFNGSLDVSDYGSTVIVPISVGSRATE